MKTETGGEEGHETTEAQPDKEPHGLPATNRGWRRRRQGAFFPGAFGGGAALLTAGSTPGLQNSENKRAV